MSTTFDGGSGTINDPYLIATADQFYAIREDVTAHYKQVANFSFNTLSQNWSPIAGEFGEEFSGSYDGDNFLITHVSLDVTGTNYEDYILIFHTITGLIKNLNMSGYMNVMNFGEHYVCPLGKFSDGEIYNSTMSVNIGGYILSGSNTGIAGVAAGTGIIKGCANKGNINCAQMMPTSLNFLCGVALGMDEISRCSNTGNVLGNYSNAMGIGCTRYVLGSLKHSITVFNSYNWGLIRGGNAYGITYGRAVRCYNYGVIEAIYLACGIAGYSAQSCVNWASFMKKIVSSATTRNNFFKVAEVLVTNSYANEDLVFLDESE